MASIRQLASCIGVTKDDISVLGDFFGFSRATVPPNASVSLLTQVNRLAKPHFHVNLVRIGSDQFTTSNKDEIDLSIITIRDIYGAQGFGIGRIEHWGVAMSDAGGLDAPTKKGDLKQITQNWTIDNDGIDVFIPINWAVSDDKGTTLGYSAIGGTCTNKDKSTGLSGATTGLWGTTCGASQGSALSQTGRVLAHELGHYLGLFHKNGQPTNLMCQTKNASNSCTSTLLTESQENNISNHCAMKEGC
jgi:hypothetical protein